MNEYKTYFLVFYIPFLVLLISEMFFYRVFPFFGPETSQLIAVSILNVMLLVMGLLGAVIALGLYKQLRTKEELSTVSFLLNPKKTVEGIKLIYYVSLLCAVFWPIYLFGYLVYSDVIRLPIKGTLFEIFIFDAYYYFSVAFGMSCLFVFEGWRRGAKKYA